MNTNLNEIETLRAGFRATLMQSILSNRGEGTGRVASFEREVQDHLKRFNTKLDGIVARDGNSAAVTKVRNEIAAHVAKEIARVTAAGFVELPN
jgi:hypothetical protein